MLAEILQGLHTEGASRNKILRPFKGICKSKDGRSDANLDHAIAIPTWAEIAGQSLVGTEIKPSKPKEIK